MNIYVFDSDVLIHLFEYYYESRFPTLWKMFYKYVESEQIVSVREVRNEIDRYRIKERRINKWIKQNPQVFTIPTLEEMQFVKEIFQVEHFQAIISQKNRLSGKPVADPFVIAKAKIISGTVVTNEANRPLKLIDHTVQKFQISANTSM